MNNLIIVSFIAILFAIVAVQVQSEPAYDTKYDDIDLDRILDSKRLVQGYVRCILGEASCTADGSYLASVLPDAITNNCSECSDKQKDGAKKAIKKLRASYPDEWKPLAAKWDPSGTKVDEFLGL